MPPLGTVAKAGISAAVVTVVLLILVISLVLTVGKSGQSGGDPTKPPAKIQAPGGTKVFGLADPVFKATTTGFTDADVPNLTFTVTRDPGQDVGSYVTRVSVTGAPLSNYNYTAATGIFTITKADATLTGPTLTKVYGDADPASLVGELTVFTAEDANKITWARSDKGEDVGTYAIKATVPFSVSKNYNITATDGSLAITPKPVTLVAPTAEKWYGWTDSATPPPRNARMISKDPLGMKKDRCLYVRSKPQSFSTPALPSDYWVESPLAENIVPWDTGALWVMESLNTAAPSLKNMSTGKYLTADATSGYLKVVDGEVPYNPNSKADISCYDVESSAGLCNLYSGALEPNVQYLRDFVLTENF